MCEQPVPRLLEVACFGTSETGKLAFFENSPGMPFEIERVYWTYGVPADCTRGMHAHRRLHQLIFAVSGTIRVVLENLGGQTIVFDLNRPEQGLYIPPVHWRTLTFGPGAVMMCLASATYSEAEYIRDYEEFKAMRTV